jgi:hypothetical protein
VLIVLSQGEIHQQWAKRRNTQFDQNTGALTPIAGSPFGTDGSKSWAIVITSNNSYLSELQSQDEKNIYVRQLRNLFPLCPPGNYEVAV